MSKSLAINVEEVKSRADICRQIQKALGLQEPAHFMQIPPGSGRRCLTKAGAEIFALAFNLSATYEIRSKMVYEDDKTKSDREYEVTCNVRSETTNYTSQGIGCCNTLEKSDWSKFPEKHYNTILKMAKKRAFVDAVLTATAASDIYTQDLDDDDSVRNRYNRSGSQPIRGTKKITN